MKPASMLAFLLSLASMLWGAQALAFAENVTHGYPSCIACHVSPSGGGVLTDYGRSLSKELMSTWGGWKGIEEPLFGAVKNTENLKFGGDVRSIQVYNENENVRAGRRFLMQNNVEVAGRIGKVQLVGTAGTLEGPETTPGRGTFLSERHYLLWETSPTSRLRVGKYRQNIGIQTPNHTRRIKSLFGFGSLSENFNLEYTQFTEKYEITVGASLGRIDRPRDANTEHNIATKFVHYLGGKSHLGGSLLFGESGQKRRFLGNIFSIIPFGEHWLGEVEIDYEQAQLASDTQVDSQTIASLVRLGNRPWKGVLWYLLFEHASTDTGRSYELTHSPGIGIQWLPLPHFEVQVEYQRSVVAANPGNENHVGWILTHFYY